MSDAIAAAKVIREWMFEAEGQRNTDEIAVDALAAQFVADYGCQQCDGMKEVVQSDNPAWASRCPAEHVELPNPYGGTVYADPDKCEWRHSKSHVIKMGYMFDEAGKEFDTDGPRATCTAFRCSGWQPRWVGEEQT